MALTLNGQTHTFERTFPVGPNGDIAKRAELRVVRIGPALAYRTSENTSVGLRVFRQYVHALEENDAATIEGDGAENGFQVGVRWRGEGFIFGSSYASRTRTEIEGEQRDIHPTATLLGVLAGSARANIDLPERWQTGLALRLDSSSSWELDLDWVGWSSVNDLTITQSNGAVVNAGKNSRSYHNVVFVYSGLRWQTQSRTTWYAGLGYDPTPVDERDASPTVSMLRKARVGLGVSNRLLGGLNFGAAYQYVRGLDLTIHDTLQDDSSTGDTHLYEGAYASRTHIVGVTLGGSF